MKRVVSFTAVVTISVLILFINTGYTQTKKHNSIWQIEPQFENAGDFVEGLAAVKKDGKWGFINRDGKFVIEPRSDWGTSDYTENLSEGLLKIIQDHKYGYIDIEGKIVIKPQFDYALNFSEGLAAVKIGEKYGYINREGRIVIKPWFDNAYDFSEGLANVTIKDKEAYINKDGNFEIELPSGQVGASFSEGLAFFRVKRGWDGKYGYINREGRVVIEPQFGNDSAIPFSDGLAPVKIDDRYGYINRDGKIVIAPQFDYANEFVEGMARVKMNEKWGLIDKSGKFKVKLQSDKLGFIFEGLAWIKIDGKCGFINRDGKIIIKPQFERTSSFVEGLAAAKKDGKWGFIKNPLVVSQQHGQFIGEIKSVNRNEIIVGGKDLASRIYLGDKLVLYSGNNIIILRSSFPMQTVTKCDLISGKREEVKSGMKVYKYKRNKEE